MHIDKMKATVTVPRSCFQAEYGSELKEYKDVRRFRSPGEAYLRANMQTNGALKVSME